MSNVNSTVREASIKPPTVTDNSRCFVESRIELPLSGEVPDQSVSDEFVEALCEAAAPGSPQEFGQFLESFDDWITKRRLQASKEVTPKMDK